MALEAERGGSLFLLIQADGYAAAQSGVRPMQPTEHQPMQSNVYRTITCAFGVLFLASAIAIFVVSEVSYGTMVAGVLVGGLGLDAIVSALRNKKSLLARIGPLP